MRRKGSLSSWISVLLVLWWGPGAKSFLVQPPLPSLATPQAKTNPLSGAWRAVPQPAPRYSSYKQFSKLQVSTETNNESPNDGGVVGQEDVGLRKQDRQLLGIIGLLGLAETAFLTYEKLVADDLSSLCSVGGLSLRCNEVFNSAYASIGGVPLTLPAMFAYGTVAALALLPLIKGSQLGQDPLAQGTKGPLLMLTTGMATFSVYLMTILATKVQIACPFCLVSAALTFGMAAITWSRPVVPEATKAAVYKFVSIAGTATFSLALYLFTNAQAILAEGANGQERVVFEPPEITTHSDGPRLQLAQHLQSIGAKMYGAFWCSHCYDQKQAFGKEAYSKINYIECAKDGFNSQAALCRSAKVPGYPTWEINGELFPGEKSLDDLASISSFPGVAGKPAAFTSASASPQ